MPSITVAAASDKHPLVASQLPSWYPHHEQHALKSLVIPLPPEFLQYLQEDGIFLPADSAAVPQLDRIDAALLAEGDYRRDDWDHHVAAAAGVGALAAAVAVPHPSPSGPLHAGGDGLLSGSPQSSGHGATAAGAVEDVDGTGGDGGGGDNDGSSSSGIDEGGAHMSSGGSGSGSGAPDGVLDWTVRFPELRAAVDAAISSLGGRVVPKMNWSCPSDALWVSATGSLACRNADQVFLLLKCSDRIAHDVTLLAAATAAASAAQEAEEDEERRREEAAGDAPAAAGDAPEGSGGASTAAADSESGDSRSACSHKRDQDTSDTWVGAAGDCGGLAARSAAGPPGPAASGCREETTPGHMAAGEATSPSRHHRNEHPRRDGAARAGEGRAGGGSDAGPGPGSCRQRGALEPVLVLKKWYNLRPEREFRCFVREGRLVAASQRDVSQAFPALTSDVVAEVRRRLWRFWQDKMLGGGLPLRDFAFDVYVPADSPAAVRLVDVNPLMDTTSSLLFEWTELGFGPGAVPPADVLLQQLQAGGRDDGRLQQQGGDQAGGVEQVGVDESWMDDVTGPATLPLPTTAEELQVRIVESAGGGAGASAAGGDGGGGLAGMMGPMLLGSRAALAMPYDMLGIADSVDKMVEMMQRQREHGLGLAISEEAESDDSGDSRYNNEQDDGSDVELQLGAPAEGAYGTAVSRGGGDGPTAHELAVLFGGAAVGHGPGGQEDEDAQAAGTVAEMMAIMGGGEV